MLRYVGSTQNVLQVNVPKAWNCCLWGASRTRCLPQQRRRRGLPRGYKNIYHVACQFMVLFVNFSLDHAMKESGNYWNGEIKKEIQEWNIVDNPCPNKNSIWAVLNPQTIPKTPKIVKHYEKSPKTAQILAFGGFWLGVTGRDCAWFCVILRDWGVIGAQSAPWIGLLWGWRDSSVILAWF